MFMMIGGGEKAGSGIHQIQSEWKNQHWRTPAFSVQDHPDRVRLVLPMVSLIPETTLASLEHRLGPRFRSLKHLEVVALATVDIEGEVSNARLQELETDHPADITQILQGLCSKGMLISDNKRRWSRYRVPTIPPPSSYNSQHLGGSQYLEQKTLQALAIPVATKKRVSKEIMCNCILQVCKGRYFDLNSLSSLLKRSRESLQNHYLIPMVAEGLIELRYPETPNRPDQAYIAKEC